MFKFVASLPGIATAFRKLASRRSRRHLETARALLANKKPVEALEAFQKAESIRPLPISAMSDIVGILVHAKRFDDAAPYARRLLEGNPGSRRALRALSRASEIGPDVLAGWRRLAQAAPEEVEPWLQIARISLRMHDFPAALDAANRARNLAPSHSEAGHIIASATKATNHHVTPTRDWVKKSQVDDSRNLLQAIDSALKAGDIGAAAVLLGSVTPNSDRDINRRRRLMRAMLAADSFSAEAVGDLEAARLSFWALREIALDEPDYADGLDRCLFGNDPNAAIAAKTHDLTPSEASKIVDAVIEGRLQNAQNLVRNGQLAAAKDQWREIQPMLRSVTLIQRSQSVLSHLHDQVLAQLAAAKNDGDIAAAWEFIDILEGLNQSPSAQSAAGSLLPPTLAMLKKLPADESGLIIRLARRYLEYRNDPAISMRLAKTLMNEGRDGEALPIWEALVAQKPDQIGYWLQIARCARRLHRSDLGQAAVERVLSLNERHAEGLRLAAHFGGPAKGARQCAE